MKRLLLCLALVAPLGVQSEELTREQKCDAVVELARAAMMSAQSGAPVADAINEAGRLGINGQVVLDVMTMMGGVAPRYESSKYRGKAVVDYMDFWRYHCDNGTIEP